MTRTRWICLRPFPGKGVESKGGEPGSFHTSSEIPGPLAADWSIHHTQLSALRSQTLHPILSCWNGGKSHVPQLPTRQPVESNGMESWAGDVVAGNGEWGEILPNLWAFSGLGSRASYLSDTLTQTHPPWRPPHFSSSAPQLQDPRPVMLPTKKEN